MHGRDAAVHSGDLTSAPAPLGATEYVDLDLERLARRGDVYAVPLVFSFNNIPFEELPDAFAGFMALPAHGPRDASYDPRTVRQRFDLAGDSKVCLPMIVDLGRRRALWTDIHLPATGGFQSVRSHGGDDLAMVAADLWQQFTSGAGSPCGTSPSGGRPRSLHRWRWCPGKRSPPCSATVGAPTRPRPRSP